MYVFQQHGCLLVGIAVMQLCILSNLSSTPFGRTVMILIIIADIALSLSFCDVPFTCNPQRSMIFVAVQVFPSFLWIAVQILTFSQNEILSDRFLSLVSLFPHTCQAYCHPHSNSFQSLLTPGSSISSLYLPLVETSCLCPASVFSFLFSSCQGHTLMMGMETSVKLYKILLGCLRAVNHIFFIDIVSKCTVTCYQLHCSTDLTT